MDQKELQKWNEAKLTLLSEQREEALWVIVYGIDKFYLTNEEKEFFVSHIKAGEKFVSIKGNLLSDRFLYISIDDEKYTELKHKNAPTADAFNNSYIPDNEEVVSPEEQEKNRERMDNLRRKIKGIVT